MHPPIHLPHKASVRHMKQHATASQFMPQSSHRSHASSCSSNPFMHPTIPSPLPPPPAPSNPPPSTPPKPPSHTAPTAPLNRPNQRHRCALAGHKLRQAGAKLTWLRPGAGPAPEPSPGRSTGARWPHMVFLRHTQLAGHLVWIGKCNGKLWGGCRVRVGWVGIPAGLR